MIPYADCRFALRPFVKESRSSPRLRQAPDAPAPALDVVNEP
jgi:hypothetical protein